MFPDALIRPLKTSSPVACLFLVCVGLVLSTSAAEPSGDNEADAWDIEKSDAPQRTLKFTATEGTSISVDVSPDGKLIVFDLLGHLYEMPIEGGAARPLTKGRSWNSFPRYSPDGAKIAFTSDRSGSDALWLLARDGGEPKQVSKHDRPIYRGAWSADGRHLYAAGYDEAFNSLVLQFNSLVLQFNLYGNYQELIKSETYLNLNSFADDALREVIYYEHLDEKLYQGGARIEIYDKKTGETRALITRPGGAFNPTLSRDGQRLAYQHRENLDTVLVERDLESGAERIVFRGLDRDRQESISEYGATPNMAWHPNGKEIFLASGGKIKAIDLDTGEARTIPFRAPVSRKLSRTLRFPAEIPTGKTRTRIHRWTHRITEGILFEALGEIYLKSDDAIRNLTRSERIETSPVYSPKSGLLYYAAWTDDDLGAVYEQPLDGDHARRLTSSPAQYGSLTLAPDGRTLAYLRGTGSQNGRRLEDETEFELIIMGSDGTERKVTDVSWLGDYDNMETKRPPGITFSPTGEHIYFTEFEKDGLVLKRVQIDGSDERNYYTFPHASRVVLSPDLLWIAFREYHRSYVTPMEFVGKPITVSAEDEEGQSSRISAEDGSFLGWSADGSTLHWTRGPTFVEKTLEDILEARKRGAETDISIEFKAAKPATTIALTGVRVLTMNPEREIIENATVLVKGNRIESVGADVEVPEDAKRYELSGHTVIPGLVDAHAHYGQIISTLGVIEQRVPGLRAAVAYGVTTMYELYGTAEKDFWLSDMQRSGALTGPRLFSTGSTIFGVREWRPRLFRSIKSIDDAREHARYNKAFGASGLKDYVNYDRSVRHQIVTAAREERLNVYSETAASPQMNWTQVIDGVTGLEHTPGLAPLYDDIVRLLKASDVGITPTLLVVYNGPSGESRFHLTERVWENPKLLNFAREEDLLRLRRPTHFWPDDLYAPLMAREMKKLHDAGILIQMGGHGQMLGLDAHWEMELMVEGGFTPHEALAVASINGAKYHGLDRAIGSIEPGKLADMIVLKENPLQDIRNSRTIAYVVLNGVIYNGDDAARLFPDPAPAGKMYFDR